MAPRLLPPRLDELRSTRASRRALRSAMGPPPEPPAAGPQTQVRGVEDALGESPAPRDPRRAASIYPLGGGRKRFRGVDSLLGAALMAPAPGAGAGTGRKRRDEDGVRARAQLGVGRRKLQRLKERVGEGRENEEEEEDKANGTTDRDEAAKRKGDEGDGGEDGVTGEERILDEGSDGNLSGASERNGKWARRRAEKVARAGRGGDAIVEISDESASAGKQKGKQKEKRKRKRTRKAPLMYEESDAIVEVSGGDEEDVQVVSESPARRAGGVTTRRRTAMKARTGSVPLPKGNGTLKKRLRDRGTVDGIVSRKTLGATKGARRSTGNRKRNGRRRKSRSVAQSPDSDSDLDDFVVGENVVAEVSGDGSEDEAEENDEEDEIEEDEDGDMEIEIEEEEEEEMDNDDDDSTDNDVDKRRRSTRIAKAKEGRQKNIRRKRTRPRDVFEARGDRLSAREQQQRLDFLVNQSAEIARDLHRAMAEAANSQPAAAGSRSPSRRGIKASQNSTGGDDEVENSKTDGAHDNRVEIDASQGAPSLGKEEKFASPCGEGRDLQPHQIDGVNWLLTLDAQGLNAILADEMGLGKTIQAVAFLASLVISGSRGPHLVIAPKNVCAHWAAEVRAWYPGQISVATHLGPAGERMENLAGILEEDNFDILVTSYEVAMRDLLSRKRFEGENSIFYNSVARAFRKVEFEYLVVDEAHRLKNNHSKLNVSIRSYRNVQRRLLLTGTPLSNNLKELWALMNVLNPRIFSSEATFEAWFAAPFNSGKGKKKGILTHAEQSVIVDRLHTIIRPFFRRRVRADVCPSFTSADEVCVPCPMSELQKALMLHFQRRATAKRAGVSNAIMCMRYVSSHPYTSCQALYESYDSQANPALVARSGKFAFLYYAIPRLLAGEHRVLIFAQFHKTLDFLEDLMDLLKVRYGRLDGATTDEERLSAISEFNTPGSPLQVFLLSTRAGGVGINLQTADTVILFDSDWNPSADLQAVSRIQRIGQKRTVHIIRLVTEKCIDDLILMTARMKLRTQAVAVGAGKFNTSRGAAQDHTRRQKDLEQLLESLDMSNFLPVKNPNDDDVGGEGNSPGVASPNRRRTVAQALREKEWARQLLRVGETSLPDVDQVSIGVDSAAEASKIPDWLAQDANLVAASRALGCATAASAQHTYEETLQSIQSVGAYSKKDRALRARRNDLSSAALSDAESESEDDDVASEEDPCVSVEQCSDSTTDDDSNVPNSSAKIPQSVGNKVAPPGLAASTAVEAPAGDAIGPGEVPAGGAAVMPAVGATTGPPIGATAELAVRANRAALPAIKHAAGDQCIDLTQDDISSKKRMKVTRRPRPKKPLPEGLLKVDRSGKSCDRSDPVAPSNAKRMRPNPPVLANSPRAAVAAQRSPSACVPIAPLIPSKAAPLPSDNMSQAPRSWNEHDRRGQRVQRVISAGAHLSSSYLQHAHVPKVTAPGSPSKIPQVQTPCGSSPAVSAAGYTPLQETHRATPTARSAARMLPVPMSAVPHAALRRQGSQPAKPSRPSTRPRPSPAPDVIDLTEADQSAPARVGRNRTDPNSRTFASAHGGDERAEHPSSTGFSTLVARLQETTKVADVDFLVDALLACEHNLDRAADYIYSHIS